MAPILRMSRQLIRPPQVPRGNGVKLRNYQSEKDMKFWIELRSAAFAGITAQGRAWTDADFRREFTTQGWWSPERMWFAETFENGENLSVGTICIKAIQNLHNLSFSVHWLMVHPHHHRRGIGRLLLRSAEAAAWDAGGRVMSLETHSAWQAAVKLYRRCGYQVM